MAELTSGGRVDVVGDYLVVSRAVKFDEEGRHVPVRDEFETVRVRLDEIEDVSFTRSTRLGAAGAVKVHAGDRYMLLNVSEEDGLRLMNMIRQPIRHVMDQDVAAVSESE